MAIKIKNEGSAASRIAAKADGGRAKRAMEAAAFVKGRDIQQKQAATAHASAPSISAAPVGHAQLIGAPGAAPLGHAPSAGGLGASVRFGGGVGGGVASPRSVVTSGVGGGVASPFGLGKSVQTSTPKKPTISRFKSGSDLSGQQQQWQNQQAKPQKPAEPEKTTDDQSHALLKTTARGIENNPHDGSFYDFRSDEWRREYEPGELEADKRKRMGDVENQLYADRALTEQGRKERAALVNDITTAIRNGKFSKEEQAQLMKEYGIADENIRMADALRDRDPTPEEQFRKNTFTDKNGVVFSPDGKMLYNPIDAEAKREDMRLRREEVTQARQDANEMKRITQMQKFIADLEKPVTVTEMVDGAAEDRDGNKIPGPVKTTRFLTEEEKNAAVNRYMASLSQFGQTQGNGNGAAQPQEAAPQAQTQGATVPGFTPVSGRGESPAPAPQAEEPTQEDDGGEDYSEYQEG